MSTLLPQAQPTWPVHTWELGTYCVQHNSLRDVGEPVPPSAVIGSDQLPGISVSQFSPL